jgi:hypothetical protein
VLGDCFHLTAAFLLIASWASCAIDSSLPDSCLSLLVVHLCTRSSSPPISTIGFNSLSHFRARFPAFSFLRSLAAAAAAAAQANQQQSLRQKSSHAPILVNGTTTHVPPCQKLELTAPSSTMHCIQRRKTCSNHHASTLGPRP